MANCRGHTTKSQGVADHVTLPYETGVIQVVYISSEERAINYTWHRSAVSSENKVMSDSLHGFDVFIYNLFKTFLGPVLGMNVELRSRKVVVTHIKQCKGPFLNKRWCILKHNQVNK